MSGHKPKTLGTASVSKALGVTVRQLQWWDENALVIPARDGRNRAYGYDELIRIVLVKALRERGLTITKVRRVLQFLDRKIGSSPVESTAGSYLVTDGSTHHLESEFHKLLNVIMGAERPVVCVSLSEALVSAGLALKNS